MSAQKRIRIYEFRRGFQAQQCGQSWRSTGFFEYNYIGVTFENGEIPEPLNRIHPESELFNVAQNTHYQDFLYLSPYAKQSLGSLEYNQRFVDGVALVGRIIDQWAVLAIITQALDFGNRPFPVQRYFCCREDSHNHYDAMATLISYCSTNIDNCTFDVLDKKPAKLIKADQVFSDEIEAINTLDFERSKYDRLYLLEPNLKPDTITLLQLWKTCLYLKNNKRKGAAWAFNVNQLQNPNCFTLVQAGTPEFFTRYYSPLRRSSSSETKVLPPSDSIGLNSKAIFNYFIKYGVLSPEQINFIKKNLEENIEEWENLARQDEDERYREQVFTDYFTVIRYYSWSALILPQKTQNLFQNLLFMTQKLWEEFFQSQKQLQQENLHLIPHFKSSAEEGVWLIINLIIEGEIKFPPMRSFRLESFGNLAKQRAFFTDKNNIWKQALDRSLIKILQEMNDDRFQLNNNEEIKIFLQHLFDNIELLKKETGARKITQKKKQPYQKLIKVFAIKNIRKFTRKNGEKAIVTTIKGVSFLRVLFQLNIQTKTSHKFYVELKKENYDRQYPNFFSRLEKEKTFWEYIQPFVCQIKRLLGRIPLPNFSRIRVSGQRRRRSRKQSNKSGWDRMLELSILLAIIAFIAAFYFVVKQDSITTIGGISIYNILIGLTICFMIMSMFFFVISYVDKQK